jgi:hypothetical protein
MVVDVDGVKSALHYLSSGVPHGCVQSPLFFSMFINDVCSCIRFSKFHLRIKSQEILISNFAVGMVLPSLFLGK